MAISFLDYSIIKKAIKWIAVSYWFFMGLIWISAFNWCGFECSLMNGKIPSFGEFLSVIISLLILIAGLFLIFKFFKAEWYKKWWSIFLYLLVVFCPLLLISIAESILCGCGLNF